VAQARSGEGVSLRVRIADLRCAASDAVGTVAHAVQVDLRERLGDDAEAGLVDFEESYRIVSVRN
jgi:hypothetical protein